jgi:hypothetical protein
MKAFMFVEAKNKVSPKLIRLFFFSFVVSELNMEKNGLSIIRNSILHS